MYSSFTPVFVGLIMINVLKGLHGNLSGFPFLSVFADGAMDMIFALLVNRGFDHVTVPVLLRWIETAQRRGSWLWCFWFLKKGVLIWIFLVDVWEKRFLLLLLLFPVLNKLNFKTFVLRLIYQGSTIVRNSFIMNEIDFIFFLLLRRNQCSILNSRNSNLWAWFATIVKCLVEVWFYCV